MPLTAVRCLRKKGDSRHCHRHGVAGRHRCGGGAEVSGAGVPGDPGENREPENAVGGIRIREKMK